MQIAAADADCADLDQQVGRAHDRLWNLAQDDTVSAVSDFLNCAHGCLLVFH
jgi:predicted metal-binding protein